MEKGYSILSPSGGLSMPRPDLFGVVEYINGHFTADIRLKDLASRFGFSPSRLSRVLKKRTGLNFTRYLRAKRLDLSKGLLERMSVTEACFEAGFESLSHFSRMFKGRYGINPSEYRKRLFGKRLQSLLFSDAPPDRRGPGQRAVSLVDQYHQKVLEILAAIKAREMDKIMEIADRCGSKMERGHKVVAVSCDSEGFQLETFSGGLHGLPGPGSQRHWYPIRKSYDPDRQLITIVYPAPDFLPKLSAGDVLLTAVPFPGIKGIAERDTEVVGLACPFYRNQASPEARLETVLDGRCLEEQVGRMIYSHVPVEDGLVSVPEIPTAPFGPGSSVTHMFIRSILLAGMAERLTPSRAAGGAGPAQAVLGRLKDLMEQAYLIKDIGIQMADKVIAGGRLFLGGWGKALNEFTWRASGLMGLLPLGVSQTTEKDVALLDASSGFDAAAKRIAPVLRGRGTCVVVVSDGPGEKPGLFLSDRANALKDVSSGPGKHGGKSDRPDPRFANGRILSSALLWMLLASYLQEMISRGRVPFVFRGFHLAGGKKYNEAVYPLFLERGY